MKTRSEDYPVWKTVPFRISDAKAIQALANGQADEAQQKRAFKWIVSQAGMLNRSTYQPGGEAADRDSTFAQGRRFIAVQTMRLATTNLEDLKQDEACQVEEHIIEKEMKDG